MVCPETAVEQEHEEIQERVVLILKALKVISILNALNSYYNDDNFQQPSLNDIYLLFKVCEETLGVMVIPDVPDMQDCLV